MSKFSFCATQKAWFIQKFWQRGAIEAKSTVIEKPQGARCSVAKESCLWLGQTSLKRQLASSQHRREPELAVLGQSAYERAHCGGMLTQADELGANAGKGREVGSLFNLQGRTAPLTVQSCVSVCTAKLHASLNHLAAKLSNLSAPRSYYKLERALLANNGVPDKIVVGAAGDVAQLAKHLLHRCGDYSLAP